VVDALRELVVSEEEQSSRVSLFEAERHAVEVRPSRVRGIQNRRLERRIWHPCLNRRRSRYRLVDVVALVLVVTAAARVRDLEQVLIAEGALEISVPLHPIGVAVARIYRERRRELWNVVH